MKEFFRTKKALYVRDIVVFILSQYLKDIFVFVHTLICNSSPELFAFVMIVIIAFLVVFYKTKK